MKRYDVVFMGFNSYSPIFECREEEDGKYCKYEDVENLKQQLEKAKNQIENLMENFSKADKLLLTNFLKIEKYFKDKENENRK